MTQEQRYDSYRLLHKRVKTPLGEGEVLQMFEQRVSVDHGRRIKKKDKEIGVVDIVRLEDIVEA